MQIHNNTQDSSQIWTFSYYTIDIKFNKIQHCLCCFHIHFHFSWDQFRSKTWRLWAYCGYCNTNLIIWSGTDLFIRRGGISSTGWTVKHWMSENAILRMVYWHRWAYNQLCAVSYLMFFYTLYGLMSNKNIQWNSFYRLDLCLVMLKSATTDQKVCVVFSVS